ncbi:hypothetical protein GCM10009682_24170 [Luedemannella flava]|uniref:XRE family transcriptional regulator n=1 Tax=Luedemannella flava TaxID=349316 RepID=A0ABP4Y8F6_9ACTN
MVLEETRVKSEHRRSAGVAAVPAAWWRTELIEGQPARDVVAARDIGAMLRFLRANGATVLGLSIATGLSETRVRAILSGAQRVTSYEVLERIATGLGIPRGVMGLAYIDDDQA